MIRRLALIVLLTGLTGCFSVKQEINIVSKEEAYFNYEVTIDAAFLAMTQKDDNKDKSDIFAAGLDEVEGVTVETREATAGSDVIKYMSARGSFDAIAAMLNDDLTRMEEQQSDETLPVLITISETADGHRFTVTIEVEETPGDDDDPEVAGQMRNIMLGSLAGRTYEFVFRAPHIIDTDATIAEDGSVVFSIPMVHLFEGKDKTEGFYVDFALSQPSLLDRVIQWFQ